MTTKERYQISMRVAHRSLGVNLLLAALKTVVGYVVGSLALFADGLHSLSDVGSTLAVIMGLVVGQKPPDPTHPYGHGKAESIAETVIALFLFLTSAGLIWGAVSALVAQVIRLPGPWAIVVAGISILTKEILFRYTRREGERVQSPLLIADAWHHRSDALSSVAALFGIIGANLGWWFFDPAAAVIVSLLILKVAYSILKPTLNVLMDGQPQSLPDKAIHVNQIARDIPGIQHVDEIRVRQYGPNLIVDLEISIPSDFSIRLAHQLADQLREKIKVTYPHVKEVFMHVNPHPEHDHASEPKATDSNQQ